MKKKLYNVLTADVETDAFTPQAGLIVPSQGIDITGVRAVMKQLRSMGYSGHLARNSDGEWECPEPCVLLEPAEQEVQTTLFQ